MHLKQNQYLSLDLKQFYPSTSRLMVKNWFIKEMAMEEDVAGLLAHLSTVEDVVSFGSPLTPVLCSLIHRTMFDRIAWICSRRGLRFTVWVDDLTISGRFVPRDVLNEIREVIRSSGLQSHKIEYRTGNKPVFITGIGVVGSCLVAPKALHIRIRDGWTAYHSASTDDERRNSCQSLLTCLGTLRHIAGYSSVQGQRCSDEMNSLRQKMAARELHTHAEYMTARALATTNTSLKLDDVPWD